MARRVYLVFELAILFMAIPLVLAAQPLPVPPLAVLIVCGAFMCRFLPTDRTFDQRLLFDADSARHYWKYVAVRCLALIAVLAAGVILFAPRLLFDLVKRSRNLWAAIMVLYPLVSVYPQELVFARFSSTATGSCFRNHRS